MVEQLPARVARGHAQRLCLVTWNGEDSGYVTECRWIVVEAAHQVIFCTGVNQVGFVQEQIVDCERVFCLGISIAVDMLYKQFDAWIERVNYAAPDGAGIAPGCLRRPRPEFGSGKSPQDRLGLHSSTSTGSCQVGPALRNPKRYFQACRLS